MALVQYDRVRETTIVLGTNDAVLLGAVTGYQSFAVVGNTNTCFYTIADSAGNWEVGLGTYSTTGPTLARTTVYASSTGGSKVSFPAGTKDIFLTYPSEKAVWLDSSGNVSPLGTIASGTWQASTITTSYGGTGLTSYSAGDLPYYATGTTLSKLTIGSNKTILTSSGTAPQWSASLDTTQGGTGLTSYSAGDLSYYATGTTLSKLTIGTNGQILTSTGTAPQWTTLSGVAVTSITFGTTGLTPASPTSGAISVAGTLITSNGGTGLSSYTAGDLPYYATGTALSKLTIGSNKTILTSSGTAPQWSASLDTTQGGTGLTTYSAGDTTYYATGTTLSKLAIGSANTVMTSSGTAPQWSTSLNLAGSLTAATDSSFTSTGALLISKGTTLQQPGSPAVGMMRYNTTTNQFEGYSGASPAWKSIGGSALSNDTATASNLYPVFAAATTGTAENLYTSNANYLYKPSTGELSALETISSNGIGLNNQTVSANYTIAATNNAMSVGPVTINNGITVTVSAGSVWFIA